MHDLVLKQSKTSPKPEIKEGVWILLLKIPSSYIITPNTYPPLFLLPWIDSTLQNFLAGVFIAISATTFFLLFLFVISLFFKESSTPQFSSETLTGLDLKLGENQFLFPTWAELCEVSLSKPLHSSALLIKAGAGIHHHFYAAELTIKISENKCYVYRNFRHCQKLAYHCVSKCCPYTVLTEFFAMKCIYVYKLLLFTAFLENLFRTFLQFMHNLMQFAHWRGEVSVDKISKRNPFLWFFKYTSWGNLREHQRITFGYLHVYVCFIFIYLGGFLFFFSERLKLLSSELNKKIQ